MDAVDMNRALDACDVAIAALQVRLDADLAELDAVFRTKWEQEHKAFTKLARVQRSRSRSRSCSRPRAHAASLEVLAVVALRDAEEEAALSVLKGMFEQAVARLEHARAALVTETYAWYVNEMWLLVKYKEALLTTVGCYKINV